MTEALTVLSQVLLVYANISDYNLYFLFKKNQRSREKPLNLLQRIRFA